MTLERYILILIFVPSDRKVFLWIYNLCGMIAGMLIAVLNHKLCARLFQGGGASQHVDTNAMEMVDINQYATSKPKDSSAAILTTTSPSTNPFENDDM